MLLVLDDRGCVFGGFASRDWSGNDLASSAIKFSFGAASRQGTHSYFGNGETFLFACHPSLKVYRWTQKNSEFMLARSDLIAFGGGGGKFGLSLDAALDRGSSGRCDTFGNAPLAGAEIFRAVRVEVWGFILPGSHAALQYLDAQRPIGLGLGRFVAPAFAGTGGGGGTKALA